MDWNDFEQYVFADVCRAIDEIAPAFSNETVLAFCLQSHSDPGTITICINTEKGVAQSFARYQQIPGFSGKTLEEFPELRENPGDFSHKMVEPRGCFRDNRGYTELTESIMNDDNGDPWETRLEKVAREEERFMEAICRVIIRLQAANKFSVLNRSSDFISVCVDRCELVHEGLERIERVRNRIEPT
jgi:hypothetical protein